MDGYTLISTIETFDQTSGNITKVVARQRSKHENHELFADAILASDVGLIDDERAFVQQHLRRDIYDVMAPASGNKITGTWTPSARERLSHLRHRGPAKRFRRRDGGHDSRPHHHAADLRSRRDGRCTNKILRMLYAPRATAWTTRTSSQRIRRRNAPMCRPPTTARRRSSSTTTSAADKRRTLRRSALQRPGVGQAIDSSSHMMCTTTGTTYSVQMYDLTTKKQTFVGEIPNSGGEGQAGSSIAADPINHLFIVEQPNSLRGGRRSTFTTNTATCWKA